MRLDGLGLFVDDLDNMVRFYRDVLNFEIRWEEGGNNVYLKKDDTLFLLYKRSDFENITNKKYKYIKGINGHFEIALSVPSYADVDKEFKRLISLGATPVLEPETEEWGQRTCYVADPEGNLIEIGSFIE